MSFFTSSAVSALAPHLVDLVKGVIPLFTAHGKAAQNASHQQAIEILTVQVSELQEAALKQARAMEELAEQTEKTIAELNRQLQRQKIVSMVAFALAIVSFGLALWAV